MYKRLLITENMYQLTLPLERLELKVHTNKGQPFSIAPPMLSL